MFFYAFRGLHSEALVAYPGPALKFDEQGGRLGRRMEDSPSEDIF